MMAWRWRGRTTHIKHNNRVQQQGAKPAEKTEQLREEEAEKNRSKEERLKEKKNIEYL